MAWPARLAAADLLADLVLSGAPHAEGAAGGGGGGGGQGGVSAAAAAVAGGAFAALMEVLNRDTYPYLNQVRTINVSCPDVFTV